jgi:hypothetical protein
LQGLDCGWKEIKLYHGNMAPFMGDEAANEAIDGMPRGTS